MPPSPIAVHNVTENTAEMLRKDSWKTTIDDTKPRYERKRRKDGSLRKARIFGKPWWYEKASWYEEKCNERRNAILERLKQNWPDLHVLKLDTSNDKEIRECIQPLVATFDDSAWCLPTASDPQERLQEQLAIYTAWAKFIVREISRSPTNRRTMDRTNVAGSQPPATIATKPSNNVFDNHNLSISQSQSTESPSIQQELTHRWSQTQAVENTPSKRANSTDDESEMNALADAWRFSAQGDRLKTEHQEDSVLRDISIAKSGSFATSSKADHDSAVIENGDLLSGMTETTEISDSEPLEETIKELDAIMADTPDRTSIRYARVWRDSDWDDVVVKVDATRLDGEYYPIPMTMLKPGSNKDLCRWDDFELDQLYSRFEVEAGQPIDRTMFSIVYGNSGESTTINTPGKYKLMLKEFSRKTRRSSAMVLPLRIEPRRITGSTSRHGQRYSSSKHTRLRTERPVERSQFTGAASDFSSDSNNESSLPPSKRPRSNEVQKTKTPRKNSTLEVESMLSNNRPNEQQPTHSSESLGTATRRLNSRRLP